MNNITKISILFITFCVIFITSLNAQNISFFNDYLNNVNVYDDGNVKQIEHLPLKSYQTGDHMLAYEDNAGNFKIYYNHFLHHISSFASTYSISDNLAAIRMNTQLKVFDDGTVKSLTINLTDYFLGDDVLVWFDDYEKRLKVYYEQEIFDLDDALATGTMNEVIVGDNIVAFVDSQGYLNVFYEGNIERICFRERVKSISAGRDIVAFVEEPVNNFQAYYFGDLIDLEGFEPVSFKTGDQFVAYVDANNYLKVFYDFKTETVSFDVPDFYETSDELMVFSVQNYFKVWYKGKVYTMESYIPQDYKMNNNVLAYIDQLGNLKFFNGETLETISYEKVTDFEIHGSIVKYSFGVNSEHIYYQGKTYKND
ncbi:MAG TPA: hypothetical protein PLL66_08845 [Bacteroidales bacterium]|nr:hypothetical protein [Bacteroidales bacterium]